MCGNTARSARCGFRSCPPSGKRFPRPSIADVPDANRPSFRPPRLSNTRIPLMKTLHGRASRALPVRISSFQATGVRDVKIVNRITALRIQGRLAPINPIPCSVTHWLPPQWNDHTFPHEILSASHLHARQPLQAEGSNAGCRWRRRPLRKRRRPMCCSPPRLRVDSFGPPGSANLEVRSDRTECGWARRQTSADCMPNPCVRRRGTPYLPSHRIPRNI